MSHDELWKWCPIERNIINKFSFQSILAVGHRLLSSVKYRNGNTPSSWGSSVPSFRQCQKANLSCYSMFYTTTTKTMVIWITVLIPPCMLWCGKWEGGGCCGCPYMMSNRVLQVYEPPGVTSAAVSVASVTSRIAPALRDRWRKVFWVAGVSAIELRVAQEFWSLVYLPWSRRDRQRRDSNVVIRSASKEDSSLRRCFFGFKCLQCWYIFRFSYIWQKTFIFYNSRMRSGFLYKCTCKPFLVTALIF